MTTLENYIDGRWVAPDGAACLDVENPSTAQTIARVPLSGELDVDRAVQAAHRAFPAWAATPAADRAARLFRLAALMRDDLEETSRLISREMGKSLPDARAEMKRAVENVEVACAGPVLQQGSKMIGASTGIDGEILRLPLGVFAMIAPFNFPGMVPFWFIPYALASGNTYVVKPSELVPLTMARLTGLIDRCGFPPGVFNVVNGDKAVGQAFLNHPKIEGISFVGTTDVCRIVASTCAQNGKRYQAMGSAKNHLVVMPDARIDEAVRNMITSCYGCAGQRCMAASVIVCVGEETHRRVVDDFVESSRQVIVSDPLDPAVADEAMVMGPVISGRARDFIGALVGKGVAEGAELLVDGRDYQVANAPNGYFVGPTVFDGVRPGMEIHNTEIFSPVVCIVKVDSLDEAVEILNDHPFGNGASIYTQSGHFAREFKLRVRAGMIGINVGIPAPVAQLPFGGMKDSLLSDIKTQGARAFDFFTEDKIITERYWPEEG